LFVLGFVLFMAIRVYDRQRAQRPTSPAARASPAPGWPRSWACSASRRRSSNTSCPSPTWSAGPRSPSGRYGRLD